MLLTFLDFSIISTNINGRIEREKTLRPGHDLSLFVAAHGTACGDIYPLKTQTTWKMCFLLSAQTERTYQCGGGAVNRNRRLTQ